MVLTGVAAAAAAPRTYVVDGPRSAVTVHVGKSGLLKAAGHEHEVVAPALSGKIVADEDDLTRSTVELVFESAALKVTGRNEPGKDVADVQSTMVGPRVLDTGRFPSIAFRSRAVAGARVSPGTYELKVTGELALHGVARTLVLPVRVELAGDGLVASGRATVEQTAFGIQPVTAGAGLVKVRNAVDIDYRFVARAAR